MVKFIPFSSTENTHFPKKFKKFVVQFCIRILLNLKRAKIRDLLFQATLSFSGESCIDERDNIDDDTLPHLERRLVSSALLMEEVTISQFRRILVKMNEINEKCR